ncbi:DNase I-like protein [Gonapodya prolifera JEL478]|uniref:DNase I-like protein n=1 Tax=Gonapodya prolifera (strain JEL478) TaxID=1344416 RepID=A0A139A1D0_GONPJ|nr:DNase I-like protein [Gonapodya prolifera JEL478]|eukprot:KXS10562.1 DNase I-like protein [Gonapodya prolifera JEL478]
MASRHGCSVVLAVIVLLSLLAPSTWAIRELGPGLKLKAWLGNIAAAPVAPICNRPPTVTEDRRINKGNLSVLVYNAEWLFFKGARRSFIPCPGRGCPWKDLSAAQEHFEHVAAAIRIADADIVHLSEVESCDALERLVALLPGMGYRYYLVQGRDVATGQNVGLLTRVDPVRVLDRTEERLPFPLPESHCAATKRPAESDILRGPEDGGVADIQPHIADEVDVDATATEYGLSKHYVTRIFVNNMSIWLAGVHFLAIPSDTDRCPKREVQAAVLKKYLQKLSTFEKEELIIMGDFNDFDHDVPDASGPADEPISQALAIVKSTTQPALLNAASLWADPNVRYSNWFDRNRNCRDDGGDEHCLIDHALVSKGLASRIVATKPMHIYKEFCGKMDSDHWPIYVEFDMT